MTSTLRRIATVLMIACLIGTASGCGSDDPSPRAGTGSTTARPSATASTPAPTAIASVPGNRPWVQNRDKESGVTFLLPAKVEPQTRPGQPAVLYAAQTGEFGVAVSIIKTPDADPAYARAVLDQLASSLESAGADDARLSQVRTVRPNQGEGIDGLITFTALNGNKMYWRIRVIVTGSLVIQVQALPNGDGATEPNRTAIDRAFEKAAKSVQAS